MILGGELRYYQRHLNDQVKGTRMTNYKQLTSRLRYQIYGLKQAGLNQTEIAEKIGVNKSTISREFRRNKGRRGWRPKQAQSLHAVRRQKCLNGKRFSTEDWIEVDSCELSASWRHFVFGVMAPVNFRHKGATLCSA